MKKIVLTIVLILIASTSLAQQIEFSMEPMFLRHKTFSDENVRNEFLWQFGASLIDRDISFNYKNRVFENEIKLQRLEVGYNYKDLRPFLSMDYYNKEFVGGGGLRVIGRPSRNTFFDITGGAMGNNGCVFNVKYGIQRNGIYAAIGYDYRQVGKYLDKESWSGGFGEIGFLFW